MLLTAACRDPDPASTAPLDSGFVDEGTSNSSQESGAPWEGTAFSGEWRGVMTVTFTAAHPLNDGDAVGIAGGYRNAEVGWDGFEDLYSPVAYQLAFPTPPEQADTLVPAEALVPYDWGSPNDWEEAGQGMKLRLDEGGPEMQACLLHAGNFPVYQSSAAMGVDPSCNPSAEAWVPGERYDVVLYGGELFEDNVLLNRVDTPPALTVSAPAVDTFNAPLDSSQDLAISWDASDDPNTRVIIRVVDALGVVISVHAADDGQFTIPAAELAALEPGPIDLVVTRERLDRVQFVGGGLSVLLRHERWGFFDLF